jgi:threonine/homoserine/homoserine lactone efflux protein
MPTLMTLFLFAVATLVLTATPGPGVLYLVARSVAQGRRAGFVSMLGIESGEVVWIAAAATGLSAVLAASTTALDVLRFAGAAYLIVLGINRWRQVGTLAVPEPAAAGRIFGQGVITQILNPKVAVFFVAFLPQFLNTAHPIAPQVAVLGILYIAIALAIDSTYVVTSTAISRRLLNSRVAQTRLARGSAATYVLIGLGAVATSNRVVT